MLKKTWLKILLILITLPVFGQTPVRVTDLAVSYTLPNGVRIIIEKKPNVLTAMEIWVSSGSASESAGEEGSAHLLEHMIFKGGAGQKPGDLDKQAAKLGAEIKAQTERDTMRFNVLIPSNNWKPVLNALAIAITSPTLDKNEFAKEQRVVLDELADYREQSARVAVNQFFNDFYIGQSYAHPVEGSRESVRKLTTEILQTFHQRIMFGKNITVVFVGNVNANDVFEAVKTSFGNLPPGTKNGVSPEIITTNFRKQIPSQIPALAFGYPVPGSAEWRDVLILDWLSVYMWDKRIGRLPLRIQTEIDPSASIQGMYLTTRNPGVFYIYCPVPSISFEKTEIIIDEEFEKLIKSGVTAVELNQIKSFMLAEWESANENPNAKAMQWGFYTSITNTDFVIEYKKRLESLRSDEIQSFVKRYFQPANKSVYQMEPGR